MTAIAQALARRPTILLLDEPTSNLDLKHQVEICSLLRKLTVDRGMTTILSMHDLNLAGRFADRICVLHNGCVHSYGPPDEVLTGKMVAEVYGVTAHIVTDHAGCPWVVPDLI